MIVKKPGSHSPGLSTVLFFPVRQGSRLVAPVGSSPLLGMEPNSGTWMLAHSTVARCLCSAALHTGHSQKCAPLAKRIFNAGPTESTVLLEARPSRRRLSPMVISFL